MSISAIAAWRAVLIGFGLVVLATGVGALFAEVAPSNYLGIALWLVAALILNDALAALAVVGFSVLLRRFAATPGGSRIPFLVFVVVQGALFVGVLVTLVVLPELIHQANGTANPSVLPLDYAGNLLLFQAALVVATGMTILALLMVRRVSTDSGVATPQ